MRRLLFLLAGAAATLALAALGLALFAAAGLFQSQRLPTLDAAPPFALIDQLERPLRSEELRGQVVLANFIYTSCRDICPALSAEMRAFQEELRGEGLLDGQVQLLSFSVDPARDTPAVLRDYAERLHADPVAWRFLTGPEQQLVPLIVEGFHLGVQVLPPDPSDHAGHTVTHSGRFVLIDRQGQIRAYYDGAALDHQRVLGDIQALLRERA
jgi:protein SCO1/2